jgi:hypothetical protein
MTTNTGLQNNVQFGLKKEPMHHQKYTTTEKVETYDELFLDLWGSAIQAYLGYCVTPSNYGLYPRIHR